MADKPSPHFFMRESDGSARVRVRFSEKDASMIEEAAGTMPLMTWIHKTLRDTARQQVKEAREQRPQVGPPEEEG